MCNNNFAFIGRVTSLKKFNDSLRAQFKVSNLIRGGCEQEVIIELESSVMCGPSLTKGQKYVVIDTKTPGRSITYSICRAYIAPIPTDDSERKELMKTIEKAKLATASNTCQHPFECPDVITSPKCWRTGCSGEICARNGTVVVTPCIYSVEFGCRKVDNCIATIDARDRPVCKWTNNAHYQACLNDANGATF